jgi:hypothetical protein
MNLHAPYFSKKTKVTFQNQIIEIKAYQIIVWVSISAREIAEWDLKIPKIPAILDTGFTHNFAISEVQLRQWTGIYPDHLPELKKMRETGERVPLRAASLWLHTDAEPLRLKVDEGIGVYETDWPRLPILGLRALTKNKLHTLIYGDTQRVVIRTPRKWYLPF